MGHRIIDLSIKSKAMKNLGETVGENLCDLGKDFLDKT